MRLLALSLLLLAGCQVGPPPAFYWNNGDLIGTSPDLGTGIAAGSHGSIAFAAAGVTAVKSSNPLVASFELGGPRQASVSAHLPGTADLILLDARGGEIDRAAVRVAPTVRLATDLVASGAVHVLEGSWPAFHVSTIGPGGEATVGIGSVSFTATGAAVSDGRGLFDFGDTTRFHGAAGTGRVIATAGSASASLDVQFVPEQSLARIDATVIDLGHGQIEVDVTAADASGGVYFAVPACVPSDASVEAGDVWPNELDQPPGSQQFFTLTRRGHFSLSCNIGAIGKVVPISY